MNQAAPHGRTFGLRGRVMLMLFAAATASGVAGWLFASITLRDQVSNQLRTRAEILVHALQASIDIALASEFGASESAQKLVGGLVQADEEIEYLIVLNSNGEAIAWGSRTNGENLDNPEHRATLIKQHLRHSNDGPLVRVVRDLHLGGQYIATPKAAAAKAPTAKARLILALTPAVQLKRLSSLVGNMYVFSGLVVLLFMWSILRRLFLRIGRLQTYAATLAQGDLTRKLETRGNDELGDLGATLQSIAENLGDTISRVRGVSFSVNEVSRQVRGASEHIALDANAQVIAVNDTSTAMDGLSRSASDVDTEIVESTQAAEISASRLREISGSIGRVSGSINQLAGAVSQFDTHLKSSSGFLKEVDSAIERLNRVAEGTSSFMGKITTSGKSVEHSTDEALHCAKDMARKAEGGVKSVKGIVDGIERIRLFANEAVSAIGDLSKKVESIEGILKVIDDIAGQTKLLSLNASIIAAQAGDYGRGFMVVADEIKALASKTAMSTREISEVIHDVLEGSQRAILVVETGAQTVDEGVQRSRSADQALSEILVASKQTSNLVVSIAKAMSGQRASASQVEDGMRDVHATTVGVRDIINRQRRSIGGLQTAMHTVHELMRHSLSTAKEQARQTEETLNAVEGIFQRFERLSRVNQGQMLTRDEVVQSLGSLEQLSKRHHDNAGALGQAVEKAEKQTQMLIDDLETFRV